MQSQHVLTFSQLSNDPVFETVDVTPEMAEEWLEVNHNNRPMKTNSIRQMARDMREGRFRLNGETIKFDAEGVLIDGQNRLSALALAGVPVRLSIASGLQPETQLTMDTGSKRNVADALLFRGVAVDRSYAAVVASGVLAYEENGIDRPTNSEQVEFIEANLDEVARAVAISQEAARKLGSKKLFGTAAFILSRIAPEDAETFMQSLGSGEMLALGNPILTLRNKFLTRDDSLVVTHRAGLLSYLALVFKAWNAWRDGKEVRALRMGDNEAFPEPK